MADYPKCERCSTCHDPAEPCQFADPVDPPKRRVDIQMLADAFEAESIRQYLRFGHPRRRWLFG
jgi:hypothetical protein